MKRILILFAGILGAQTLPPVPGKVSSAVIQSNISVTICTVAYSKSVRPPASYTGHLKRRQIRNLHLPGSPRQYEEDHRVPLELGGDPISPDNLWPELWRGPYGARAKDRLENALHRDVCRGRMTLQQAQEIFLGDYWHEYRQRYPH